MLMNNPGPGSLPEAGKIGVTAGCLNTLLAEIVSIQQ